MPKFKREPIQSNEVTTYDRQCFETYLELLDAEKARIPWETAYGIIFGEKFGDDPSAARARYKAHLKRAKWMSAQGFRQLI